MTRRFRWAWSWGGNDEACVTKFLPQPDCISVRGCLALGRAARDALEVSLGDRWSEDRCLAGSRGFRPARHAPSG